MGGIGERGIRAGRRLNKVFEVQKYLSTTDHIDTPSVWFMYGKFHNKQSADHKAIVDLASAMAIQALRGRTGRCPPAAPP